MMQCKYLAKKVVELNEISKWCFQVKKESRQGARVLPLESDSSALSQATPLGTHGKRSEIKLSQIFN